MAPSRALTGVVPIVVTPFGEDGRVDVPSLHRLVDAYCLNGNSGVAVPAIASEIEKLSADERQLLIRETVSACGDRVPVIAGVLEPDATTAARATESALAAGAAGILCRAPSSIRDPEALRNYFLEVGQAGSDFLVIQDLSWDDYGMELPLILELVEALDALRAIKIEVVRTGYKATEVLERAEGRVGIWSGWAMLQMIETLDRGVQTYNPSAYNEPFVRVAELYSQGKRQDAISAFERVLPYLAWSRQHSDINLQVLKRYCVRKGYFSTSHMRAPAVTYDEYHQRFGDELIERMIAWEVSSD